MPKVNGVGYGPHTPLKQDHFAKTIRMHLGIVRGILQRAKEQHWKNVDTDCYYYFDINAGPGHDPTGLKGSPLIFLEEAQAKNLPYHGVFIEKESESYAILRSKIHDPNVQILCGDHRKLLPNYFIPDCERYGVIYVDPSGNIPPFDLLAQMSRWPTYSKLDVLINVACATIKRVRICERTIESRNLKELMATIQKKYWIVRKPVGNHEFSFLIGTNWKDFPAYEKEGFYNSQSPLGQQILDRLTYTTEELAEHTGQLPFSFLTDLDTSLHSAQV